MGVSPSGTNVTPVVLSPKKEEEEEEVSGGPLRAAPYSCRNQFEVVCSRPKGRKKKNRSCRCPAALKMSADFLSNICVSLIFAFPRIEHSLRNGELLRRVKRKMLNDSHPRGDHNVSLARPERKKVEITESCVFEWRWSEWLK